MKSLLERIAHNPNFDLLSDLLTKDEPNKLLLKGLAGSAKSFAVAATFVRTGGTICALLPDKESSSYFYDDLVSILGDESVMFYPSAFRRSIEYMKENKSNIVMQTEVLSRLNATR